MTGARIEAELIDAELMRRLRSVQRFAANPTPLMRAAGVALTRTTRQRFRDAKDPQGQPWAKLNPAYSMYKRGPGILRDRAMAGGLMGSITFQASGRQVIVGTNKVYGAVHQFGATITPVRAKALRFFIGPYLHVRASVTIPARPYLGFGPADQVAVRKVVGVLITKALGAR